MVTFKYEAAAGVLNDEKRFFTTTEFPEMAPAYKLPCSQRFRPFPEELFRK
jgi:hypothetical protein